MHNMKNAIILPSIYPVTCHTDHVGPGSTFVAIKGMKEDGLNFIIAALEQGARKIVVQQDALVPADTQLALADRNVELVRVADSRLALAQLSAQALDYPAQKLKILAVTGTKGKTTSSFLLEHVLQAAGYKTALLSTVKNKILNQEFATNLTTQLPDYLHIFFQACVENNIDYVIMEVAAQATTLHRVADIYFDGLIFTNFSQEHAEFYDNLDTYFAAKTKLFEQLKPGAWSIINADDERVFEAGKKQHKSVSFGLLAGDLRAEIISNNLAGLKIRVIDAGRLILRQAQDERMGDSGLVKNCELSVPALVGTFNVYNILGVIALAQKLGISIEKLADGLKSFAGVPGRLQRIELKNQATAFIDYAHNPSSYQAVLSTLKPLSNHLIVVFGCGGDRDSTKRPVMGNIASTLADIVVLTSDNPRSEDPEKIIAQIKAGIDQEHMHKVHVELDREEAIKRAYQLSRADSMIILLGKGPDEYQIIGGVKNYFSEAAILRSL